MIQCHQHLIVSLRGGPLGQNNKLKIETITRQPALEENFRRDEVPAVNLKRGYNKKGYQSDEFEKAGDINLLFLGDSWGQGDGLELTYCFDHLLRDELEKKLCCRVGIWNLSHGGKGYDYIARALMCSLPHLHPDIVIPIFGVMDRHEYYLPSGECLNLSLGAVAAIERGERRASPEVENVYRSWSGIASPHEDMAQAIRFFNLVATLLEAEKCLWGYTTVDWLDTPKKVQELIKFGWFDARRYLGFNFDSIDVVSDSDAHPGAKSHRLFADRLFDWIIQKYESGRLASDGCT